MPSLDSYNPTPSNKGWMVGKNWGKSQKIGVNLLLVAEWDEVSLKSLGLLLLTTPAAVRFLDLWLIFSATVKVHIGVGNFHRAHQCVFVDDTLSLPGLMVCCFFFRCAASARYPLNNPFLLVVSTGWSQIFTWFLHTFTLWGHELWGYQGIGLMPGDSKMRDVLKDWRDVWGTISKA